MPILLDSHVHLYPIYGLETFLDSAWENLNGWAGGDSFTGVLGLMDYPPAPAWDVFSRELNFGAWSVEPAGRGEVLRAQRNDNRTLHLWGGSQTTTIEGLEVLALGRRNAASDGRTLVESLEEIWEHGGLPILPWGVGKWLGNRGRAIMELLKQEVAGPVALGDNSGRPWFWPEGRAFKWARRQGIPVFPGTDPLPLKSDERRAGSWGVRLENTGTLVANGILDGEALLQFLKQRPLRYRPFGTRERAWGFIRNQGTIQLKKSGFIG